MRTQHKWRGQPVFAAGYLLKCNDHYLMIKERGKWSGLGVSVNDAIKRHERLHAAKPQKISRHVPRYLLAYIENSTATNRNIFYT